MAAHSDFETQRRQHQKSETGVSLATKMNMYNSNPLDTAESITMWRKVTVQEKQEIFFIYKNEKSPFYDDLIEDVLHTRHEMSVRNVRYHCSILMPYHPGLQRRIS